MIFWVNKRLLRKNFSGMTVWPFIIMREHHQKEDIRFVNHERIHLRQQVELLIVFFYLWYFIEFLIRWAKCKNKHEAYHNISFEREAYANENNQNYLINRSFWAFRKFL